MKPRITIITLGVMDLAWAPMCSFDQNGAIVFKE
jgi:hypothetical protein